MKMKLILSMAFSILTASMLYALEFYDVSRPDIAKIKLNISAKNESALNTVLIQTMERQLKHSLLFENASAVDAEYLLEIDKTIESGSIVSTLKSSAESGFALYQASSVLCLWRGTKLQFCTPRKSVVFLCTR